MSEKKFSEKLGKNFLSFSDLRNLKKEYGITLDIYGNHNENFYTHENKFHTHLRQCFNNLCNDSVNQGILIIVKKI